MNTYYLLN